jgi:hypothetical protein
MSENERDPQADLALCEAATPGPWVPTDEGNYCWGVISQGGQLVVCDGKELETEEPTPDIALIAASREALPWYIRAYLAQREEIERLRAENDSLHVVLQEANDTIERMSREQSEESALARLRAWVQQREGFRTAVVSVEGCQDAEMLELIDICHPATNMRATVCVWNKPIVSDKPNHVGVGTEDKPASLGEMADAALERWERLKCKRCGHRDGVGDLRWETKFRCSECGELRKREYGENKTNVE